jgi:hypothetical protein
VGERRSAIGKIKIKRKVIGKALYIVLQKGLKL